MRPNKEETDMKRVITKHRSSTTLNSGFATTKQAAEFLAGLAQAGRIDSGSIEDYAGTDLLNTLQAWYQEETGLPLGERATRTVSELRSCVALVKALRGDSIRINTHRVLMDVTRGCQVGSAEAKEIFEAAESLIGEEVAPAKPGFFERVFVGEPPHSECFDCKETNPATCAECKRV
jgi:hypothetical protein